MKPAPNMRDNTWVFIPFGLSGHVGIHKKELHRLTHAVSTYIHMYVCTYTQIHAYTHTNYVKCIMCTSTSTYPHPSPPLPTHLTTAHSSPPTVTRCELPTNKPSPDRVSTVPPAAIPAVGLTAVMSRSLKENCWVDWTVLVRPVASLKVSWTGPVTGPPSARRVVQDSLRTTNQPTKRTIL